MIIVETETSADELAARFADRRGLPKSDVRAALLVANSHIASGTIRRGTTLLVPEAIDSPDSGSVAVDRTWFDVLRAEVESSLEDVTARAQAGHKARAESGKTMTALFRSAAFKRALNDSPEVIPQVEAALEVFKQEQAAANAAAGELKALRQRASQDFDRLAKLLS
jgi:hypothetical protein